ncbi:hypothetical protein [Neobacillus dielmonensis]|nr:hypothetical protein [Neobacillus dielmonensis]
MNRNRKNNFPSRKQLDQAFHYLHDQINQISVTEEVERIKEEKQGNEE